MHIETIEIAKLVTDPANVRTHTPRNIQAIAASLRRFGQQKPIVIDAANVVRAGNGTLAAAQLLGWTEINAVRSNLRGSEATAYAIADNRAGDAEVGSTFNDSALAALLESLRAEDAALAEAAGYSADELARLLAATGGAGVPNDPATTWTGMPECESEDQTAAYSIRINFASAADRDAFAALIQQTITDKTRSLWYPPAPIGHISNIRFVDANHAE
jgi:hypothetical protein